MKVAAEAPRAVRDGPDGAAPRDVVVAGSAAGTDISPFSGVCGATKFAVEAAAEALRREAGRSVAPARRTSASSRDPAGKNSPRTDARGAVERRRGRQYPRGSPRRRGTGPGADPGRRSPVVLSSLRDRLLRPGPRPKPILFDHLAKCAGASLIEFLRRRHPERETHVFDGYAPHESAEAFRAMPAERRHAFRLIAGRGANRVLDAARPDVVPVTLFRDPVDRIVSHYVSPAAGRRTAYTRGSPAPTAGWRWRAAATRSTARN